MVLISGELHVAAVLDTVGVTGTTNCASLLKLALTGEVQLPLPAVTVYEVPSTIPDITPPEPTVGPAGENV